MATAMTVFSGWAVATNMQLWRCECGKREYYESGMPPAECQGCEECGSNLQRSPHGHRRKKPHKWVPRYDPASGQPVSRMCEICYKVQRLEPKKPQPDPATDAPAGLIDREDFSRDEHGQYGFWLGDKG